VKKKPADNYLQLSDLAVKELIMHYNPVGILINEHGEILYIHGRTGKYLEPAHGEAGVNILKMAREGLKRPLNNAIQRTVIQKTMTRFPGIRVKTNGKYTLVNLTVRPVSTVPGKELVTNLLLVIFEELSQAEKNIASKIPGKTTGEQELITDALIKTLEQELKAKDEYLQSTIEEMDTTNEELKSTNEELQSVNEELQSTNEELETSKEELQSMNEELTTVNTELQTKFSELTRTNNDMNNLLAGTGVGTVFVDQKLQIRRFTPSIKNLINLIQTDIGRPLAHIVSNLVGYNRLVEDVGLVLDNLTPKEIEVQTTNGSYYLMKILPYRTLENVIEGAVITFIDITELKKIKQALIESESLQRLAAVVRDSSDAIILQDFKGKILAWNPGAERLFGWDEREALGMNMNAMIPENQRKSIMTKIQKLAHGKKIESFHIKKVTKSGQVIEVNIIATTLLNDNGESYAISTLEREV
jgi:two-component system CheB/CheR fusion protein